MTAEPTRYGVSVMNLGYLADARLVADLARRVEAAGWDAFLVWDHLGFTCGAGPGGDGAASVGPWVEAGATWWLEMLHGYRGTTADLVARVEAGPPR